MEILTLSLLLASLLFFVTLNFLYSCLKKVIKHLVTSYMTQNLKSLPFLNDMHTFQGFSFNNPTHSINPLIQHCSKNTLSHVVSTAVRVVSRSLLGFKITWSQALSLGHHFYASHITYSPFFFFSKTKINTQCSIFTLVDDVGLHVNNSGFPTKLSFLFVLIGVGSDSQKPNAG